MKHLLAASIIALSATISNAATFTMTFEQSGTSVVANGAGAFDLTGMTLTYPSISEENRIISSLGFMLFGIGSSAVYDLAMTGPGPFGTGGQAFTTTSSGDQIGIWSDQNRIYVPVGYVSNAALSNSASWASATLADLGLSFGTSSYTFGNNTFNVVVQRQVSPVPLPASLPLLLAALGGIAIARRQRRS